MERQLGEANPERARPWGVSVPEVYLGNEEPSARYLSRSQFLARQVV